MVANSLTLDPLVYFSDFNAIFCEEFYFLEGVAGEVGDEFN